MPYVISRTDTYNPSKTKFWVEQKVTASMEQATRTELTDKTTVEAEVDTDGDHVLLMDPTGKFALDDFGMNMKDASAAAGSTNPPGVSLGSVVIEFLQVRILENVICRASDI